MKATALLTAFLIGLVAGISSSQPEIIEIPSVNLEQEIRRGQPDHHCVYPNVQETSHRGSEGYLTAAFATSCKDYQVTQNLTRAGFSKVIIRVSAGFT